MKGLWFTSAVLFVVGFATAGHAQGFEVCAGDDYRCQTPGTVGLSCLGPRDTIYEITQWKASGDALRVNGGRWQMIYAEGNQVYDCANVLVYRTVVGSNTGGGALRVCAADDQACQGPGQVAYACFGAATGAEDPAEWQYTGDAMRIVNNRWKFWYSSNSQYYDCKAVLVGRISYGFGSGNQIRVCAGDDPTCQVPGALGILCDHSGNGLFNPSEFTYTGRSMAVSGARWSMQYNSRQTYTCETAIVAMPTEATGSSQPNIPSGSASLPPGSVIFFNASQCPAGWSRIGQVIVPGSPVSGMSYCLKL